MQAMQIKFLHIIRDFPDVISLDRYLGFIGN